MKYVTSVERGVTISNESLTYKNLFKIFTRFAGTCPCKSCYGIYVKLRKSFNL